RSFLSSLSAISEPFPNRAWELRLAPGDRVDKSSLWPCATPAADPASRPSAGAALPRRRAAAGRLIPHPEPGPRPQAGRTVHGIEDQAAFHRKAAAADAV